MDIIIQGIRWVLWILCRFVLIVTDGIFNIVTSFYKINLYDFKWIWNVYWIFAGVMALFVGARILVMFFRNMYENDDGKFAGTTIFTRIICMFLMLSFVPVGLPILSDIASNATQIITVDDTKPSDILIDAGLASFEDDLNTSISLNLNEGEHAIDIITSDTINDKNDDNKTYKYFNNLENILLIAVLSGMCVYAFLSLAIQIIQRMIGLLLKIAMAPYSISGLVDPADNSASMWSRLVLADILTQVFQILLLWIVMYFATHLPNTFNLLGKGLAFIGAVFAIIVAPSGIAQLLGGDIGAQTGMQMMQHFQALSGAVRLGTGIAKTGLELGGGLAVSGVKNTIAGGTYGIGRMMGGRTLNPNAIANQLVSSNGGGSNEGGNSGGGIGGSLGESESSYGADQSVGGTPSMSSAINSVNSGGGELSERTQSYMNADGTPSMMSMLSQIEENTNPNVDNHQSAGFSVGSDGILHYDDGKTTNNNYQPNSFIGNMAGKAGAWAYQKSAQRLFNTPQQRDAMKRSSNSTSIGNIGSNIIHNFNSPVANMQVTGETPTSRKTQKMNSAMNNMNTAIKEQVMNQMNNQATPNTTMNDINGGDMEVDVFRKEF